MKKKKNPLKLSGESYRTLSSHLQSCLEILEADDLEKCTAYKYLDKAQSLIDMIHRPDSW